MTEENQLVALDAPRRGILFVLSAPSGAGKDTLLNRVMANCRELERCVTYTTRLPRAGETEGVDYHFVDAQTFQRMVKEEYFFEWKEVYGNFYGNSRKWVVERVEAGRSIVLRIDVQGSLDIKARFPEAVLLYIAPPSKEEQERRLRGRNSELTQDLAVRLEASEWEMAQIPNFDYLVVNDDLEEAVSLACCIIRAEFARIRPSVAL